MEYRIIPDTAIVAIDGGILYRSSGGELHTIDFETCAHNYQAAHPNASTRCVGERNMDDGCFVFCTSGVKTRIVFEKRYVFRFFHRFLSGGRNARFLALQHHINQAGYSTRDLS